LQADIQEQDMKKLGIAAVILGVLLVLSSCGGGKYSDVNKAADNLIKTYEDFAKDINASTDASGVAKVLRDYTDKMDKVVRELQALEKKYPELGDLSNPPEELKDLDTKLSKMSEIMASTFGKLMEFADDSEVMDALQGLQNIGQE